MSDFDLIRIASGKNRSALRLAERAHRGVTRKSGNQVPYLLHPVYVATVLAGAGADRDLVCAGCLHDVVEDTDVTLAQIRGEFGAPVATLVAAVTKDDSTRHAPLADQARIVFRKAQTAGEEGEALKGGDVLANITDLVLDAEEYGRDHWLEVLGGRNQDKARAAGKIDHYLELAELLQQSLCTVRAQPGNRVKAPRYPRLAAALSFRLQELTALRVGWDHDLLLARLTAGEPVKLGAVCIRTGRPFHLAPDIPTLVATRQARRWMLHPLCGTTDPAQPTAFATLDAIGHSQVCRRCAQTASRAGIRLPAAP